MVASHEFRLAVGAAAERRSSVWKFSIQKNEIYILSRMFGSDTKVSLHASGTCQWSNTDNWVLKVPGRRNKDRHLQRWLAPRPGGTTALHVFQIRIPETELRQIDLIEDLAAVHWLPVPPKGHSVSLECYISPIWKSDPQIEGTLPLPCLFSLPLADGRWFVVLHHVLPLDGRDLETKRQRFNAISLAAGIEPNPNHRAVAFTVGNGVARGLIELCTVTDLV